MKVLLISKGISGATSGDFRYSGVFTDTFELAKALSTLGIEVSILTPKIYYRHLKRFWEEFGKILKSHNINHYFANTHMAFGKNWGSFRLRMFWAELRIVIKFKPDIIQYMQFGPSSLYSFIGKKHLIFYSCYLFDSYPKEDADLKAKSSEWGVSRHDLFTIASNLLYTLLAKFIGSRSIEEAAKKKAVLVLMHPQGYKIAVKKFGFLTKVSEITKGVNLEAAIGRKVTRHSRQVIFIGEILYGKGIFDLVEAFRKVNTREPKIKLIIVGAGPKVLVKRLKRLIRAYHINARYLGSVNYHQKWKLYLKSDILCLPSYLDAFPSVIMEALACGLPVITAREIDSPIIDGKTGIKVPRGDIDSLSRAILRLVNSRDLINKMSKQAQKEATVYSWLISAQKFKDFFTKMLNV